MPRFHGRVKTFFQDRNAGYITELGETGTGSQDNVMTDRDVYFRPSDMRVADPRAILRKSCTGHILEYDRETDEQGRHRARDITNLYETALPCEEGLVIFKRYYDINREALRREGKRAVDNYLEKDSGSKSDRAPYKKRGRGRRYDSKTSGGGGGGGGHDSYQKDAYCGDDRQDGYHAQDHSYRDAVAQGPSDPQVDYSADLSAEEGEVEL